MTGELLPCPFCGSAPDLAEAGPANIMTSPGFWWVECSRVECGGMVGYFPTSEEARTVWNTRAESAEVERLRECLREVREALALPMQTKNEKSQRLLDVRDIIHKHGLDKPEVAGK